MFLGREQELKFLEEEYKRPNGRLVILYGRRRAGKTELLRKFNEDKDGIFFSCQETTDQIQRKRFSEELLQRDHPAKRYLTEFPDWEQAFSAITELPAKGKKLLIIDEFPYLCKGDPSVPSILQNLWDERLRNEDLMLVLCGSSMSFIEKELLAEKNPLYGRATGIYKLAPMNFYEASLFFPDYSDEEKILAYSVLGGIPHYLAQFDPKRPLAENIQSCILTKGATLYSEVDFLLHQELRETTVYNSIIEAIALGSTTLNEITQKALIGQTSITSTYLKNLIELGIVEREFPINFSGKEQANKNRGTYRLSDQFFRFWYTYVFSNHTNLELGDAEGVYRYHVGPTLYEFAAKTFEYVCREFLQRQQLKGRLPYRYQEFGGWHGKIKGQSAGGKQTALETEIDVAAIAGDKKHPLLGECKFRGTPFLYADYVHLREKANGMSEVRDPVFALFSRSGFEERLQKEAKKEKRLTLYSLPEIVRG